MEALLQKGWRLGTGPAGLRGYRHVLGGRAFPRLGGFEYGSRGLDFLSCTRQSVAQFVHATEAFRDEVPGVVNDL